VAFILLRDRRTDSLEEFRTGWARYQEYLDSIADRLPPSARAFALAAWHYDFSDPRCPHDAWVERVEVLETGSGDRHEVRSLQLRVRLLGAYHDGHIELMYEDVRRYRIGSRGPGHGDWLYDEIRLSADGHVLHEIEIGGDSWEIECQDVAYEWKPKG
jgi:hypothetical protein